eukprot:Sdes_comp22485_c0_seq1m20933
MAAFNDDILIAKLKELSGSQQSIQTLSNWFIFHRKKCEDTVRVWVQELRKCENPRKLLFLYLANDILQTGRKKGAEYAQAFASILPGVLARDFRDQDQKTYSAVFRVLQIWEERSVFDSEFVKKLIKCLGNKAQPSVRNSVVEEQAPVALSTPRLSQLEVEFNSLNTHLQSLLRLGNSHETLYRDVSLISNDLLERDSISNIYDLLSAESFLKEVKQAEATTSRALECFTRREEVFVHFLSSFNDFLAKQTASFAELKSYLVECRDKYSKLAMIKAELQLKMKTLPLDGNSSHSHISDVNSTAPQGLFNQSYKRKFHNDDDFGTTSK